MRELEPQPQPSPLLGRDTITPADIATMATGNTILRIAPEVPRRIESARDIVDDVLRQDQPSYGVNRGLGPLRNHSIPLELQAAFQGFIFASHEAAVGPMMSRAQARSVLLARISVLAQGNSGVTWAMFESIRHLIEADVTPAIPSEGTVGSADLAALSTVGTVLIGSGSVLAPDGTTTLPARDVLRRAGITPVELQAKDAHSLLAANSASLGLACLTHQRLLQCARAMDLAAMSTVEAMCANVSVFDDQVISARPHPGQVQAARRLRELLDGGDLAANRVESISLQDPLSIRTIPQVHGSLLEHMDRLEEVLTIELNSMSENPFMDRERRRIVSNGNFSTIRLSMALEATRLIVAHCAMLVERRIAQMIRHLRSDRSLIDQIVTYDNKRIPLVPAILSNSAASLLARVQQLAAPVSLYGAPVGDGVEDHNAQAYSAGRLLDQQLDLVEQMLAIEVLVSTGLAAFRDTQENRQLGTAVSQLHAAALPIINRTIDGDSTNQRVQDLRELLFEELTAARDHTMERNFATVPKGTS